MDQSVYDKLEKVYRLVNNGATEGERNAAREALDRLLEKYNLDVTVLSDLELRKYVFKYSTLLELKLIERIMYVMTSDAIENSARGIKSIHSKLKYLDWVTIECAYEYFRRHMKAQWKKVVEPELKAVRKQKSRARKRKRLNEVFFGTYVIKSKLYKDGELTDAGEMSPRQLADRMKMLSVEGGSYNRQITGGLLLTE